MAWWDTVDWSDPIERDCPLNQGLVGWWMGAPNCYGGTRLQDLCNKNHGELTNMDTTSRWGSSEDGAVLSFDGVDDYIQFTNPLSSGLQPYTILSIVKIVDKSSDPGTDLFWAGTATTNQAILMTIQGNLIFNSWWANDQSTSYTPANNTWNSVAIDFDGSQRSIYINGNRVAGPTSATGMNLTGTTAGINRRGVVVSHQMSVFATIAYSRSHGLSFHRNVENQRRSGFPDMLRHVRRRSMMSVQIDISNTFQKNNNKILTGSSLNFYGIKTGGNL